MLVGAHVYFSGVGMETGFLEPVYLNEKMVLNCTAYLFRGIVTEMESSSTLEGKVEAGGKIGIPLLHSLLSPFQISSSVEGVASAEGRTVRRYTLGSLHMTLLDELEKKKMIQPLQADTIAPPAKPYVSLKATLQPIDYQQLLELVRTLVPVAVHGYKAYSESPYAQQQSAAPGKKQGAAKSKLPSPATVEKIEHALTTALGQLQEDYLASKHLEMMLVDPQDPTRIYGVVDLDVGDTSAIELRAKLSGGTYTVIGKVSRFVDDTASINLFQRSLFSPLFIAITKLAFLNEEEGKVANYINGVVSARAVIEQVCPIFLPGPAVRIVAMSVCI